MVNKLYMWFIQTLGFIKMKMSIIQILLILVCLELSGQKLIKSVDSIFIENGIRKCNEYKVPRFNIYNPFKFKFRTHIIDSVGKITISNYCRITNPKFPSDSELEIFNKCHKMGAYDFETDLNSLIKNGYATNNKRKKILNTDTNKIILKYNEFGLIKKVKVFNKVNYCKPRKRIKKFEYL